VSDKVPDWLKEDSPSTSPDQNNRIKKWLLRPPAPSITAWLLFFMGAMFAGMWLYQRVEYVIEHQLSFPFDSGSAGSLSACLYFVCLYGAELLPPQSRRLAAGMRIIGLFAGIVLLSLGALALWSRWFP
jgi:lysylphosphatidylglycerol synthetase-like protein (DUF2156 family)